MSKKLLLNNVGTVVPTLPTPYIELNREDIKTGDTVWYDRQGNCNFNHSSSFDYQLKFYNNSPPTYCTSENQLSVLNKTIFLKIKPINVPSYGILCSYISSINFKLCNRNNNYYGIYSSYGVTSCNTGVPLKKNQTYTIGVTISSTEGINFYLDGVLSNSFPTQILGYANEDTLIINSVSTGDSSEMILYNFNIYDKILSDDEILLVHQTMK